MWWLTACVIAGVFHRVLIIVIVGCALALRAWASGTRTSWVWAGIAVLAGLAGVGSLARVESDGREVARAARGTPCRLTGWVASFPRSSRFGTAFVFETVLEGRRIRLWARTGCFDVNYGEVLTLCGRIAPLAGPADGALVARGAAGTMRARFAGVTREDGVRGDSVRRHVLWPVHRAVRTRLCRALGARAALPVGLLLGERGYLDRSTYDAVVRLGVVHLLAISGMHLAVIAGLAMLASWFVPRWRYGVLVVALTFYVGVVGDVASLTRAYVMALILTAAHALARPLRPMDALAKTLLVVTLASPVAALSVGLQLSFAATLAVIAVASRASWMRGTSVPGRSRVRRAAGRVARGAGATVVLSLAVEVFIAPLQLIHFGRVSAVGPLATPVFLVPVVAVQVLSILAAGLHGVPLAGPATMAALGAVSHATESALQAAGRLVPGTFALPEPRLGAYYGGLAVVWLGRRRRIAWLAGTALIVLSFAWRG